MNKQRVDRLWSEYPIGTKAHAFDGGYWIRVANGWKWFNGNTFPTPGADAFGECIELPVTEPRTFDEVVEAIRSAGGDGWDKVEDIKAEIDELRGRSSVEQLSKIRAALAEYHAALKRREHGGVAQDKFVKACEAIFDCHFS